MTKICFTASSGGHFEQLMMLKPLMDKYPSFIITEKTKYSVKPEGITTYYLGQINRRESLFLLKFINIFINTLRIFIKERPDVVVSTGALVTFPLCIIAKIFRKKVIFIESFAKIHSKTLTGKLVNKFADLFIIQWEELKELYPEAVYGGGIY